MFAVSDAAAALATRSFPFYQPFSNFPAMSMLINAWLSGGGRKRALVPEDVESLPAPALVQLVRDLAAERDGLEQAAKRNVHALHTHCMRTDALHTHWTHTACALTRCMRAAYALRHCTLRFSAGGQATSHPRSRSHTAYHRRRRFDIHARVGHRPDRQGGSGHPRPPAHKGGEGHQEDQALSGSQTVHGGDRGRGQQGAVLGADARPVLAPEVRHGAHDALALQRRHGCLALARHRAAGP